MASNSDRARMVGSNFDRVRIVVVGDAGISTPVGLKIEIHEIHEIQCVLSIKIHPLQQNSLV